MSISLYDFSIAPLLKGLTSLAAILAKSEAYAAGKKMDALALPQSRLFPDMHPLSSQVQIACDTAKGAAARLAGIEAPKHADTETTIPELQARVSKTIEFLQSVTAAQLAGDELRSIELKFPNGAWKFTATGYITDFVLPNFYFHSSMAYALLRKGGVEIGKMDFLGDIKR